MNKKIIGLILTVIVIAAIAVGAYIFLMPQYKEFNEQGIQLEIPSDADLKVQNLNDEFSETTVYYTDYSNLTESISFFDIIRGIFSPNNEVVMPFTGISIITINPNSSYNEEIYNTIKDQYVDNLNYTIIDSSKHDYNGTIYNVTEQANMPSSYAIISFDDTNMRIITLFSTDLKDLVHMAQTFKTK
jgi:hypothetical protein